MDQKTFMLTTLGGAALAATVAIIALANTGTDVSAPGTRVESTERETTVDAPFAKVETDQDKTRVKVPFVDIEVPRDRE
jgi:hypothetical protein